MLKESKLILGNQSGVALVVALLMIVILSLIGIASSSNSTFDITLSGIKRGTTEALHTADWGANAVLSKIGNFNSSSGYVSVPGDEFDPVTHPEKKELANEWINTKYLIPKTKDGFSLPNSVNFSVYPDVTIYHTSVEKVPRGLGMSAIAFKYNYYIIDSMGHDQLDLSLTRSKCDIREKIVRLLPTGS